MNNVDNTITSTCTVVLCSDPTEGLAHFELFLVFADLIVQDTGLLIRLQACDHIMQYYTIQYYTGIECTVRAMILNT